jgi:hypothetical protein
VVARSWVGKGAEISLAVFTKFVINCGIGRATETLPANFPGFIPSHRPAIVEK